MKRNLVVTAALICAVWFADDAQAEFSENVRQALQEAVADARAAMEEGGLPAQKTISLLPLGGDQARYVEGLLKNAVTAAGLTYVEGGDDPLWDEVLEEVEWDERKADMLDPATLVTFGKLKGTQLLMYGVIRSASESGQKVFVEIELHLSSIETKEHVWGGVFAKRFYVPGQVTGIIDLDQAVREVLRNAVEKGAAGLGSSGKIAEIRTVAVVPLAGDIDGYVRGLAENMLSQTKLYPKNLDVGTLAEARQLLRDQPKQADALLYGAVRDLSRKVQDVQPFKTTYEINAEVQLRIQSASTGEILWSATLSGQGEDVETTSLWEAFLANRRIVLWAAGGLAALMVLGMFFRATRRAR